MKPLSVPNFLKARNPEDLRKAMLKLQLGMNMTISFYDIQFVKGQWYAWYEIPLKLEREVNGDK